MLAAIPNPGRDNPVPVGGFIQEWWAASSRYGGRHNLGIVGGFVRNQHLEDPSNLTGLVDLGDRDAHLILKNGSAAVEDFKAKPKEYCNIAERARPQTFKKEDLLLRRSERTRLESLIRAKPSAKRGEYFTHSHGYREVTINGHRISLGARQADVVRQLHEAALAGNPWRNGKELLRNAGSESNRMHDLFKSKRLEWPLLIESDRRGLYRLAISDQIDLPGKRTKK